jgi:hypothetical protein
MLMRASFVNIYTGVRFARTCRSEFEPALWRGRASAGADKSRTMVLRSPESQHLDIYVNTSVRYEDVYEPPSGLAVLKQIAMCAQ